jgi:potassium-transporting ATPase KdpC subunit
MKKGPADMKDGLKEIKTSIRIVVILAFLLCGIYPLTIWLLGQGLFPSKANGSPIVRQGVISGSRLIGQQFTRSEYFHPRPSSAGEGYDAFHSGGSNLGPTSKALIETIRGRLAEYREENGLTAGTLIPADAVTASASGLDPHISLKNAYLQAARVAKARNLAEKYVHARIEALKEGRDLGILGEPRINVLMLNLDLDGVTHDGR